MRLAVFVYGLCLFLSLHSSLARAEVPEHLFLKGPPPVLLPLSARVLVDMETRSNPISLRSNQPFWIEHLKIPLKALEEDQGLRLDPRIYQSLVYTENGEKFVRWILNPEDSRFGGELETKLREHGIPFLRGKHFIGYLTSSRSCIVQDPESGVVFSVKSSTNATGGTWNEKKETIRAAKAARLLSDYLMKNFSKKSNPSLRLVPEPLAFYFGAADQAVVIRQYQQFNSPKQDRLLIPAFSSVHETEGRRLARLNGSDHPYQFWADWLLRPMAKALGDLLFNFGLIYNSPHGQNFLIETDREFRPTGLIHARDFADSNPQPEIMSRIPEGEKVLEYYKTLGAANLPRPNYLVINFNPFTNATYPSWGGIGNWPEIFWHHARQRLAEAFRGLKAKPQISAKSLITDYWWELFATPNDDPAYQELLDRIAHQVSRNSCSALFRN